MTQNNLNLSDIKNIFPKANSYLLDKFVYKTFMSFDEIKQKVIDIKKQLNIENDFNADDLLLQILLFEQSIFSANKIITSIKNDATLHKMATASDLDNQYLNILITAYAKPFSKIPLQEKLKTIDSELPETINTLLETMNPPQSLHKKIVQENLSFLENLYKNKKIDYLLFTNLKDLFLCEGAFNLEEELAPIYKQIDEIKPNFIYKEYFAIKILLATLTIDEVKKIIILSENIKFSILPDDLQTIILKYKDQKEVKDIVLILEGLLRRLPYNEESYENMAYAIRVMCDGRPQVFEEVSNIANTKQAQKTYMNKLTEVPYFKDYQDELTLHFFGKKTPAQLALEFRELLKTLPNEKSYKENPDIAIKIMLGKLPYQVGFEQAKYRASNTSAIGADDLQLEALRNYKGTKSKEEVLDFFRQKLIPYTFHKERKDLYCLALAFLTDELNGENSPQITKVALEFLQLDLTEKELDQIIEKLEQKTCFEPDSIINAYKKFYRISQDKADAIARILNMLD